MKTSPIVDLPSPAADRPSWVRVGIFAAVCFVVGIAWPKLAGVRLGPSAPSDAPAHGPEAASSGATASQAPATASAAPVAPAPVASAVASAPVIPTRAPSATSLSVKPGMIVSCKTEDGDTLKGKACGPFALDAVALPRLKKLSECPASAAADGKLSVMLHVDFGKTSRLNVGIGKSSTVDKPDDFTSCLTGAFEGATVAGLAHENARYTVAYAVRFGKEDGEPSSGASSSGTPTAPAATAAVAATGATPPASMASANADSKEAGEVVWDVAIVRDKARTGDIVARLPRGTKVKVSTFQDGWYQIGYGDSSEGWVYRRAIGK